MAVPTQPLPGYFYDELSKIRVLEPDTAQTTEELREECKDFVDKIGEFQRLVGGFIGMVDELAQEVEQEKMKAIGARNLLKSIARERDVQRQQLQSLLVEKKMELERLRVQYESLKQVEQDQLEITEELGLK